MSSLTDTASIQRLADNAYIDVDYFDCLEVQHINSVGDLKKIFQGVDMSTYYADSYEPKLGEQDVYVLHSHEEQEEDLYLVPCMTFMSWWHSLQQF